MLDEYGCREDGLIDDTSQIMQAAMLNLQEVEKAHPELTTNSYWAMALVMLDAVAQRIDAGAV